MGLRFRRSVRLFPGVRLNFSRSGVSTTVGVRGATMTIGGQGAHVNVGLPGSGLSYRTRVAPPPAALRPHAAPERAPAPPMPAGDGETALAPGERQIRSAEVSALTSPGLGELKRLINEAAVRRAILIGKVASEQKTLAKAQGRLKFAQAFIIRLFTAKSVPRLAEAAQAAEDKLDQSHAELDGCYVEVDFGFDDATLGTYAALTRSFEALSASERIWDITSTMAVNRVAERTVATTAVRRTPVRFEFAPPFIIKSKHQVMKLGNVGGRDLQIFPGFVMMRDATHDFGLVEFREFNMALSRTRFIEDGPVPSDSQTIGQTWKKANKDGSPDRRFKDNYPIPIVEYGELVLNSPTGLLEAYQFSHYAKAQAFANAFDNHKRALATMAAAGGLAHADEPGSDDPPAEEVEATPPALAAKPAKALWLDWVALAAILASLGGAGVWVRDHGAELSRPPTPAIESAAPVEAAPAPPRATPHHRRQHRRKAVTAASGA